MLARHTIALANVLLAVAVAGCGPGNNASSSQRNGTLSITVGNTPTVEGSGSIASEDQKVEGFHGVHASNAIEVIIAVNGTSRRRWRRTTTCSG